MPSKWGYLGATGLAVLGVVAAVICLIIGLGTAKDRLRDATLVGLGDEGLLTIPVAGPYTIYYLGPPVASTKADLPELRNRLKVSIRSSTGSADLVLQPYLHFNSVRTNQPAGIPGQVVAFQTVRFPESGDYVVRAGSLVGIEDSRAGVAFSKSPEGALARWALVGLATATLAVVIAALWMILLAGARGRARRASYHVGPGMGVRGPPPALAPGAAPGPAPMTSGLGWGPAGPTVVPPRPAGYEDVTDP